MLLLRLWVGLGVLFFLGAVLVAVVDPFCVGDVLLLLLIGSAIN
jgi:hypothetical protein